MQQYSCAVGFRRQTYFLAVFYVDMFLSRKQQTVQELQCLGITSLYVAMKVEEVELQSCNWMLQFS